MTALALITAATAEAHEKHGRSFEESSLADRMLIMGEEFGEIARAVMDFADSIRHRSELVSIAPHPPLDVWEAAVHRANAARRHLLHEVAQLGSLCMRWLETDGAK